MAWLNLTMPNQTVRNSLKAKKIKLPQMNFFLEKQLIKFSCTYWPVSFCKTFKKILELVQSYEDVRHFRAQNCPFVLNKNFLVQAIVITFIYLLALFIVENFKKFLQRIQNYVDAPFLDPFLDPFASILFFVWKIISIIPIYLLAPFIVQNLKKILPADPEL